MYIVHVCINLYKDYTLALFTFISSACCFAFLLLVGAARLGSMFCLKGIQSELRGKGSAHSMTQEAASFFFLRLVFAADTAHQP